MTDDKVEQAIIDNNLTAPRVTKEHIDNLMGGVRYESWVVPDTTTTVVAAIMPDDFVLATGTSASVSKANFNPEIGYNIAKDKAEQLARDELWKLEGYVLKQKLNGDYTG